MVSISRAMDSESGTIFAVAIGTAVAMGIAAAGTSSDMMEKKTEGGGAQGRRLNHLSARQGWRRGREVWAVGEGVIANSYVYANSGCVAARWLCVL